MTLHFPSGYGTVAPMKLRVSSSEKGKPPVDTGGTSVILPIVSWLLVVLWAGLMFFMSSNTGTGLDENLGVVSQIHQALKGLQEQVFGPDIDVISPLAHFCEYTVFGALWANALRHHLPLCRACLIAIVCASLYGVTDELHQLFVPGRMCDPLDWLVDTLGGGLGSGIIYAVFKGRR